MYQHLTITQVYVFCILICLLNIYRNMRTYT